MKRAKRKMYKREEWSKYLSINKNELIQFYVLGCHFNFFMCSAKCIIYLIECLQCLLLLFSLLLITEKKSLFFLLLLNDPNDCLPDSFDIQSSFYTHKHLHTLTDLDLTRLDVVFVCWFVCMQYCRCEPWDARRTISFLNCSSAY